MHNGFKKLALGIAGVALLSGTTFATGPTVSTIPDLIITDRLPAGAVANGAGPYDNGVDDSTNTGTWNIYDFTGAVNLSNFVSAPLATNGLDDVLWDFAELDGPGGTVLSSGQTIQIDDGTAAFTGLTSEATFASLTGLAFNSVSASDPLDFRNVNRTIGTGPVLPSADFLDETTIKMYFATTGDSAESLVTTEFNVYTTNDVTVSNGDDYSLPSSVFTAVEAFDDFAGWSETQRFNAGARFISGGNPINPAEIALFGSNFPASVPAQGSLISTADEFNPARLVNVVPAATDSLTLQTTTGAANSGAELNGLNDAFPQLLGFGSFDEGLPSTVNDFVDVSADTLYMIKWNLTTPTPIADVNQLPLVQLIVGETGAYGLGRSLMSFDINNDNNLAGTDPFAIRQYFHAHDAGEIGFFINVFDQATNNSTALTYGSLFPFGHRGHDVTVESVEVFSVNTAGLTGENVVFNQGQAAVPLVAGEPAPPSGESAFALDLWAGRDQFAAFATPAEARNASFTPDNPLVGPGVPYTASGATAETLSYSLGTGEGPAFIVWDTLNSASVDAGSADPILSTVSEALEVSEGTLVVMDYWLSATGSLANLPFTRVGMASATILPGGGVDADSTIQGYVAYHEFTPRSTPAPLLNGGTVNPGIPLVSGSAARARLVWEVQLTSTASDTGTYAFRPAVESFVIPAAITGSTEATSAGQINIHRVVVTTYDKPSGAESASVPPSLTDL